MFKQNEFPKDLKNPPYQKTSKQKEIEAAEVQKRAQIMVMLRQQQSGALIRSK